MWKDGQGGPGPYGLDVETREDKNNDDHYFGSFGALIAETYEGINLKINRGGCGLARPRSFFALYPTDAAIKDGEYVSHAGTIWQQIGTCSPFVLVLRNRSRNVFPKPFTPVKHVYYKTV